MLIERRTRTPLATPSPGRSLISCMNTILQPGGRTIEEFIGRSETGDFNEALRAAVKEAKLTLGTDSIRWKVDTLSGITQAAASDSVVVTIKAKIAAG